MPSFFYTNWYKEDIGNSPNEYWMWMLVRSLSSSYSIVKETKPQSAHKYIVVVHVQIEKKKTYTIFQIMFILSKCKY